MIFFITNPSFKFDWAISAHKWDEKRGCEPW